MKQSVETLVQHLALITGTHQMPAPSLFLLLGKMPDCLWFSKLMRTREWGLVLITVSLTLKGRH